MAGPLGLEKERNHAAIWMTSLLIAGALVGLAYLLFASFEHDSWFPSDWRRFLNRNEVEAFGGGGLALWILISMLMYAFGAFSKPARDTSGWGSGPEDASIRPRKLGPAARGSAKGQAGLPAASGMPAAGGVPMKEGRWPTIEVVMRRERRACTGDLVLTDRRFFFICYRDESLTKSTGGKAVASQFGLLGALIHALVAGPGEKRKKQQTNELRHEFAALSLEEQVNRNQYSLSMLPGDIKSFSSSTLSGTRFETVDQKYPLTMIDKSTFPAIKSWCDQHGIENKGLA
jgi:hypothetical protein